MLVIFPVVALNLWRMQLKLFVVAPVDSFTEICPASRVTIGADPPLVCAVS